MSALEGIIIRAYPYGEADLIIRLITNQLGKLSLLAKYARKSKRRFAGGLDIFDSGLLEIKKGRGSLINLINFSSRNSFLGLRDDLDKFCAASFVCECFDFLVPEESQESNELFDVLRLGLEGIRNSEQTKDILRTVFLSVASLLKISGFLDLGDDIQPSVKNLRRLVQSVETHSDKKLVTITELEGLLAKAASIATAAGPASTTTSS